MINLMSIRNDESKVLNCILIMFIILPMLYGVNIIILSNSLQVNFMNIFTSSITETINLMVYSACFLGAYVVKEYQGNKESFANRISLGITLISNIIFMNFLASIALIYYIHKFIGFKNIFVKDKVKDKKEIKALIVSILIFIVSLIVIVTKLRLQILF